jgi:hypothetical protein
MDTDHESSAGRVPLPGFGESGQSGPGWQSDPGPEAGPADSAGPTRADGIRHVRRMSNWTAAALIVGTGAATVALAHQAFPHSTTAAATAPTTGAGTTAANAAAGPSVGHSVATTSASGVTTTTTTRTVNGKTVVSHVRHAPAYHDN